MMTPACLDAVVQQIADAVEGMAKGEPAKQDLVKGLRKLVLGLSTHIEEGIPAGLDPPPVAER